MTYEPFQENLFTDESTSLVADFLVSHTRSPENEKGQMMTAISGQRCLERLKKLPHVSSWAKTFSDLLIGHGDWFSSRCSLTWKLRGTKYGRVWFQLAARTHPTNATGSGLLPTPRASRGFTNPTVGKTRNDCLT